MNLEDKVVVITGASHGLGKALAEAFAERKVNLVLAARSSDELEQAAKETNAVPVVTDVAKEQDVKQLAAAVIEKFDRIDIWINNAGMRVRRTPIEEIDAQKFHEMIDINLFGTFYGSREALKQLKRQKSGTIINILSTSAAKNRPTTAAYGSSKMAAIGFTNVLRNEVINSGIKVISVYPGGIKTNFHQGQVPEDYDTFLPAEGVAEKIVANLELDDPQEEQTILEI
jgi:uncharacterized protein